MLVGIEILPQTHLQVAFCAIALLLGAMVTGIMFGEIAVVVSSLNRANSEFNSVMDVVNTSMKNFNIPQSV